MKEKEQKTEPEEKKPKAEAKQEEVKQAEAEPEENQTEPENKEKEESKEQQLQKALNEAKAEAEENKRKWYLVTAEYENYRKRTASSRSQAYAEGRADVVSKLFPIADNLDRALASCESENTKKGLMMVISSFEKILDEEKITVIDPLGEEFDANKCEAIMAVDGDEGEESGKVKQVFLKGYEQNGKVLRFAQVSVVK